MGKLREDQHRRVKGEEEEREEGVRTHRDSQRSLRQPERRERRPRGRAAVEGSGAEDGGEDVEVAEVAARLDAHHEERDRERGALARGAAGEEEEGRDAFDDEHHE